MMHHFRIAEMTQQIFFCSVLETRSQCLLTMSGQHLPVAPPPRDLNSHFQPPLALTYTYAKMHTHTHTHTFTHVHTHTLSHKHTNKINLKNMDYCVLLLWLFAWCQYFTTAHQNQEVSFILSYSLVLIWFPSVFYGVQPDFTAL